MEKLNFKEFLDSGIVMPSDYIDKNVVDMYLYNKLPVREISRITGKSIGEIYRILRRQYSEPNRRRTDQSCVISLADSGMPVRSIADFTGYTERHVRNILKSKQ